MDTSIFPSACKKSKVTPSLKRGVDTEETNFRPLSMLSVLPAFGKLFEDLMLIQMQTLNDTVLHTLVSAYRPGYSSQNVLLYMLNAITDALDNGKYAAAVTTDLSLAFDCLPPNLMYHKLIAYGVKPKSALLIHNYLSNRSQNVKIGSVTSKWMSLAKGTPQWSKLGPAFFNLFISDLLHALPEDSAVNFADDNTLYAIDRN